jgi:hypothetical protein
MTNVNGRTWDICRVHLPNGSDIKGFMDTTWGEYFYFTLDDNQWYKGSISKFESFDVSKFEFAHQICTLDLTLHPRDFNDLVGSNDSREVFVCESDFWADFTVPEKYVH